MSLLAETSALLDDAASSERLYELLLPHARIMNARMRFVTALMTANAPGS